MPPSHPSGLILGIESSCDETAAAVVRNGTEVLSNIVASQVTLHADYGGVVPELASREHLRNLVPVVRAAMLEAGVAFDQLDAVAVTEGPGLAGALLVGILYSKALAFGLGKAPHRGQPSRRPHPRRPHAVRASAHAQTTPCSPWWSPAATPTSTSPGFRRGVWTYRNVGRTVDDAAGEAYDKVAKLLGLGYPGGPWIDGLAPHGDPSAVPFQFNQIKPREPSREPRFDFSFSGIKTAVLRYVQANQMAGSIAPRRAALEASPACTPAEAAGLCDAMTLNLIASFQAAVVKNLLRQTFAAAEAFGAESILVSGGVAANRELRRRFAAEAAARGLAVAFPSLALSTDNAAMIAAAAWPKFLAGETAPESMGAEPQLRLG